MVQPDVKIVKAYKYRLKVNAEVATKLEAYSGCARFVWNKVLAFNLARLEQKQLILWYGEMCFWLTLWRQSEEYHFLNDAPAQVLQQKLKDLEKAFRDAFDKNQPLKRMPKWRKKIMHNSIRYPQGCRMEGNRIYLPKIGWVGFYNSRKIEGIIKNVTVSKTGKHWYIAVQTEIEVDQPIHKSASSIGIDMGVANLVSLSDGEIVAPMNAYQNKRQLLAKLQRKLRLKKKFSSNWRKVISKVGKLHTKIANFRNDYLHKLSNNLSKNHAVIVLEDLQIMNMTKSASGTVENPGSNVKAKSGLNRTILDQGWGELSRQLAYKSLWLGGRTVLIAPHYTSQTCALCGHKDKMSRKTQAYFNCTNCGHKAHADVNAAKNILAVGQTVIACGREALATSLKQELLEASNQLPAIASLL